MRSRYSAFAKRLPEYLLATWHPETRPERLDLDPTVRWVGLRIVSTPGGGPGDGTGTVEFTADYELPTGAGRLHELSRFEQVEGVWTYRTGTGRTTSGRT